MAESFPVSSYMYYDWSSRSSGKTNLILKGTGGETCSVWFEEDESAELQKARKGSAENFYIFYYHHSQLQHLIDMLRNEKPIWVFYNPSGLNNSRISTSYEPVGEGEN